MAVLHACLLVLAFVLALPLGREHRTIAFVLGGACASGGGAWLASKFAASWDISIALGLAPAALVAWGAWGVRGLRWWPLATLGLVGAEACALAAWARLGIQQEHLGLALALAWGIAAWIGLLALRPIARRGRALGRTSRLALLALLTSLLPEAFGWIAWGRQIEGGFALANVVTCIALLVICTVQIHELRKRAWTSSPTSSSPLPSESPSGGGFGECSWW